MKTHLRGHKLFLLVAQLFYFSCSFQGGGKSTRLAQTSRQRGKGQATARCREVPDGSSGVPISRSLELEAVDRQGREAHLPRSSRQTFLPETSCAASAQADGLHRTEDPSRTSENELHSSVKPLFTARHPGARVWDLAMTQSQKSS